jgi:hypothetical protein
MGTFRPSASLVRGGSVGDLYNKSIACESKPYSSAARKTLSHAEWFQPQPSVEKTHSKITTSHLRILYFGVFLKLKYFG